MLNVFRATATAAVLALAPLTASATTLIEGGSANSIVIGGFYTFDETYVAPSAESLTFTLSALTDLRVRSAQTLLELSGAFEGVSISLNGVSATLISSSGVSRTFSVDGLFNPTNGLTQDLLVGWTGISDHAATLSVQVIPSAVPVPAAGLMLLTALGGVAAMRRRKTA